MFGVRGRSLAFGPMRQPAAIGTSPRAAEGHCSPRAKRFARLVTGWSRAVSPLPLILLRRVERRTYFSRKHAIFLAPLARDRRHGRGDAFFELVRKLGWTVRPDRYSLPAIALSRDDDQRTFRSGCRRGLPLSAIERVVTASRIASRSVRERPGRHSSRSWRRPLQHGNLHSSRSPHVGRRLPGSM